MAELNLSWIYESVRDLAKEDWVKGDIERIISKIHSGSSLEFVADNILILKERGLYEKALIPAYKEVRKFEK